MEVPEDVPPIDVLPVMPMSILLVLHNRYAQWQGISVPSWSGMKGRAGIRWKELMGTLVSLLVFQVFHTMNLVQQDNTPTAHPLGCGVK